MEAKVKSAARKAILGVLAAGLTAAAVAQTAPTMEFSSDSLNLRFKYPGDLVVRDASQALHDGHLVLFGISGDSDPELSAATHCLKPDLLLELPGSAVPQTTAASPAPDGSTQMTITPAVTGTILLAELDIDCLTPEQQMKAHDLQSGMAELVNKVPGMHPILQPTWYNVGWQKVHVAAAQGQPHAQPDAPSGPLQLFTMGFSTSWNNHLLVWYFSSNSTETLDRMTKSTVRFGRAAAAPLYPVTIGNASPGR